MGNQLSTKREPHYSWMSNKVILVLFLIILPFCRTSSQVYNGFVKGKDKGGLHGASIVVTDDSNRTIAFVITDENGSFTLRIPEGCSGSSSVTVSYLGYKTLTVLLSQIKDGIIFTLQEESIKLKEVRISSHRIKQGKDTLTYSVAGFRQRQDRSLADVLEKMPGIEVKPDGKILFQGKAINKFYIEGLDLMGSQYGIANKNISADKVASVQVLQNHQPIKSLHGVSFSEQAALNIVLKDDIKAVWNGTADIGFGYGENFLYDNRLMAMRFNKNFQTLMMYKNNNTGEDIGTEVSDLTVQTTGIDDQEYGLLSMPDASIPELNDNRYTFNESHLAAGNWLWRIGKNSDLRIQGSGLLAKENLWKDSHTTYLDQEILSALTEEYSLSNIRSEWKGDIKYQYNGNRAYAHNNIRAYIDFNKSTGHISVNGQPTEMAMKPYNRWLTNDFRLSYTTKNHQIYDFYSHFSYNYLPGQLLTLDKITERLDLRFISTQNALKYKHKFSRHYLNNQVGIDYKYQDISVTWSSADSQHHTFTLLQPYCMPSFSFLFPHHRIETGIKISYTIQRYKGSQSKELWVEPSLSWNWQLSPLSELWVNLRQDTQPIMCKSIYDTPIFTSYQTKQVNRGKISNQHIQSISLVYKYSNPIKGVFFNFRPMLCRTTGNIIYKSNIENNIYTASATNQESPTITKAMSARISKSYNWAKLTAGLSGTYTVSDYNLLIGESIDNAKMTMITGGLDYSFRPNYFLSIEGKSAMQYNCQKNQTHNQLSSGGAIYWQHNLYFFFFPSDSWIIACKNDLFHHNKPVPDFNYFCDLSINYKKRNWEISIEANNIIGTSLFQIRVLGNTIENIFTTRLRPRELLFKLSFDLF